MYFYIWVGIFSNSCRYIFKLVMCTINQNVNMFFVLFLVKLILVLYTLLAQLKLCLACSTSFWWSKNWGNSFSVSDPSSGKAHNNSCIGTHATKSLKVTYLVKWENPEERNTFSWLVMLQTFHLEKFLASNNTERGGGRGKEARGWRWATMLQSLKISANSLFACFKGS